MSLKDILVCVDATDAGEARLRLAAAIAREHRAHLSAAYITPEVIPGALPYDARGRIPPTGAAWMPQAGLVAGLPAPGVEPGVDTSRELELADIIEQRFREEVRSDALEGNWHMFAEGDSSEFLALLGAVDLVIYGQASSDYRLPTGFQPGDIVVGGGRPMLVVPYAGAFAGVGKRALVAWDGSREAARALHDALPLLAKAEAVVVLGIGADEAGFEDARPGLDRVVRHLNRHGLSARAEQAVQGDVPIADLLLSRAADLDADLIVAGAYHHSQLREALLGGVSRDLLDHMTVPVLMSH